MFIKRDLYLNKIVSYMWDGQVKVITGIRRCGKSYLLRTIFRDYLLEHGVTPDQIITVPKRVSHITFQVEFCETGCQTQTLRSRVM